MRESSCGDPGEVVIFILALRVRTDGNIKWQEGKAQKLKEHGGRRCKHAKRQDLLVEQEVRGEACVFELRGSLSWPARPLQMKGACCSMPNERKTCQSFFFLLGKMRGTYVCACLGQLCLAGKSPPSSTHSARLPVQ